MAQTIASYHSTAYWFRCLGKVLVPEQHIGIVYKDEVLDRFLTAGYHPRPNLWREKLIVFPLVRRVVRLESTVLTADGLEATIKARANHTFNPGQAAPNKQAEAANRALQFHLETLINPHIKDVLALSMREFVGRVNARQLRSCNTQIQLQEWLLDYVQYMLAPEGIVLCDPNGIMIDAVYLSEWGQPEWNQRPQQVEDKPLAPSRRPAVQRTPATPHTENWLTGYPKS